MVRSGNYYLFETDSEEEEEEEDKNEEEQPKKSTFQVRSNVGNNPFTTVLHCENIDFCPVTTFE